METRQLQRITPQNSVPKGKLCAHFNRNFTFALSGTVIALGWDVHPSNLWSIVHILYCISFLSSTFKSKSINTIVELRQFCSGLSSDILLTYSMILEPNKISWPYRKEWTPLKRTCQKDSGWDLHCSRVTKLREEDGWVLQHLTWNTERSNWLIRKEESPPCKILIMTNFIS